MPVGEGTWILVTSFDSKKTCWDTGFQNITFRKGILILTKILFISSILWFSVVCCIFP